jgi:hypothetical protein
MSWTPPAERQAAAVKAAITSICTNSTLLSLSTGSPLLSAGCRAATDAYSRRAWDPTPRVIDIHVTGTAATEAAVAASTTADVPVLASLYLVGSVAPPWPRRSAGPPTRPHWPPLATQ